MSVQEFSERTDLGLEILLYLVCIGAVIFGIYVVVAIIREIVK